MDEIYELLGVYKGKKVILIDLLNVLFRSYYSYSDLVNSAEEHTGMYYGLARLLQSLELNYSDDLILLVDDGAPLERKTLDSNYKANRNNGINFNNRKYIVDCIIQCLPNVYRVFNNEVEADDLMFSISRIKDFNNTFILYTNDKDLYQALDSTTYVSTNMEMGSLVLQDKFSDRYVKYFKDLEPYQIPYYRAVLGDKSDNLSSISTRFPSAVAYYFAKNYVLMDNILSLSYKPDSISDKQFEKLQEIYKSEKFIVNLRLMKLSFIKDFEVQSKCLTRDEVKAVLLDLELLQYASYLQMFN